MLEVVFLILKIAGIILAVILGILIVAVCLVLFVPLRYRGDFSVADAVEGDGKDIGATLRATWFLRFIRVYVLYEKTVRVRVKVLFFTLMDTAKEKTKRKKEKDSDKKKKKIDLKDDSLKEQVIYEKEQAVSAKEQEKSSEKKQEETSAKEMKSGEDTTGKQKKPPVKEKKSIKSQINNILQTIRAFCDKMKRVKEKTSSIEELWFSDHVVNSRSLLGKQLVYLLKHTKPKKLEGYLRFGFEEPSTTGYAMAVYGILYPIWSPKLSVEPDFEKQILDCHILIKGKVRAWHFVRAALRMILSKDVRRAIKDIKKL